MVVYLIILLASGVISADITELLLVICRGRFILFLPKVDTQIGTKLVVQQGLEIHGLEECGPWRCTVFNWFPKHLRYTDFGQKPWRYTVFDFLVKKNMPIQFIRYKVFQFLWLDYFVSQVKCTLTPYSVDLKTMNRKWVCTMYQVPNWYAC